ncbi:hypothetical protein DPEC_G00346840 [Dallia pectoralis]|uniref:Uncharacterized protein n=1 Tax=Dallia pectoralis TaxID=75939 RepID=A0ACC2F4B5_DALPE|nr:hypothetical protein DPEC_G00346840 [Dallia pectoralis]
MVTGKTRLTVSDKCSWICRRPSQSHIHAPGTRPPAGTKQGKAARVWDRRNGTAGSGQVRVGVCTDRAINTHPESPHGPYLTSTEACTEERKVRSDRHSISCRYVRSNVNSPQTTPLTSPQTCGHPASMYSQHPDRIWSRPPPPHPPSPPPH